MPKIYLIKLPGGYLAPATAEDADKLKAWGTGSVLATELSKPRNGAHHRKAFALFQLVFENQERYATLADLLVEIKLRAGHYQEHVTVWGELVYVPKSISFAAMDQSEFEQFYRQAIDAVLKYFMPNTSARELEGMVEQVQGFA